MLNVFIYALEKEHFLKDFQNSILNVEVALQMSVSGFDIQLSAYIIDTYPMRMRIIEPFERNPLHIFV